MKKIFLLFIIGLMSFVVQEETSISLKGIILGSKHQKELVTTVANIKGVIVPDSLKNGTCYMISFYPSQDGGKTLSNITYEQFKKLKDGVEHKYGVKFDFEHEKDALSAQTGVYTAFKGNVQFNISVRYNILNTPEYTVVFYITDMLLYIEKQKETHQDSYEDF